MEEDWAGVLIVCECAWNDVRGKRLQLHFTRLGFSSPLEKCSSAAICTIWLHLSSVGLGFALQRCSYTTICIAMLLKQYFGLSLDSIFFNRI